MTALEATIKVRRDTAVNWVSVNPVMAAGEAGYDSTNGVLKVGDGTKTWLELDAVQGDPADLPVVTVDLLVADADLSGGTFTSVDLVDAGGNTVLAGLPRAYLTPGVMVAVRSGTDGGKIYTATASGPCPLYRACNAGDLISVYSYGYVARAYNTAGTGGVSTSGAATLFGSIVDARITRLDSASEHAFQAALHASDSYFDMAADEADTFASYGWSTNSPGTPSAGVWVRYVAKPILPTGYTPSNGDAIWVEMFSAPATVGEGGLNICEMALMFTYVAAQNRWRVTPFWEHTPSASVRTITDAVVTNGDATVTSEDADFTAADEGVYIILGGSPYVIESVTAENEIELTEVYAGSTDTGVTAVIGNDDYELNGEDATTPWYIPIDGIAEGAVHVDFDNGSSQSVGRLLRRVHLGDADEYDAQGRGWTSIYSVTRPVTDMASMATYASKWWVGYSVPSMHLIEVEVREEDMDGTVLADPSGAKAIAADSGGTTSFSDTATNTWAPESNAQAIDPTA